GRSIWMIDDLTVLRQLNKDIVARDFHLFQPLPSYRLRNSQAKNLKTAGTNHPGGVMVHFYLKNKPGEKDTVKLEILDNHGALIRTFSNQSKEDKLSDLKSGGNRFVWDMRCPDAKKFEGLILWSSQLNGPRVVPGEYRVRLSINGKSQEQAFSLLADPRSQAEQADFQRQFAFVKACSDKLSDMHTAIGHIRDLRSQMKNLTERLPAEDRLKPIREKSKAIDSLITNVEQALYQTKNRSSQDPLNFPVRLNDKLANLMELSSDGDYPPTDQAVEVKNMLFEKIDAELAKWSNIQTSDLPALNKLVRDLGVDVVRVKKE
ncbi:MAG: glycosyl hydrolase, partial [Saprospiraceae bacterium]|nr:glycosyl hydrolase [Saprospiraceae bacterium]